MRHIGVFQDNITYSLLRPILRSARSGYSFAIESGFYGMDRTAFHAHHSEDAPDVGHSLFDDYVVVPGFVVSEAIRQRPSPSDLALSRSPKLSPLGSLRYLRPLVLS